MKELLQLVDEDTNAFNQIMAAFALPKGTDTEKQVRSLAIDAATVLAIKVPFRTMELSYECFDLVKAMAEKGNPNSVSDAGVGALCARAAVKGCYLNVRINAQGIKNNADVDAIIEKAEVMNSEADRKEQEVWGIVMGKMKS